MRGSAQRPDGPFAVPDAPHSAGPNARRRPPQSVGSFTAAWKSSRCCRGQQRELAEDASQGRFVENTGASGLPFRHTRMASRKK
jgi:hypothetical protein